MLTEICKYLKNWFDRNQPKFYGTFFIVKGVLYYDGVKMADLLKKGQYIRIVGSSLNDGVYLLEDADFEDEVFEGAVWALAIPPAVIAISEEITAWTEKYGKADSAALSPFNSESFAGYSYSKSNASGTAGAGTWQDVFGSRLTIWRKIV